MMTRWRCVTHNTTLEIRGSHRSLQGALGVMGRCALARGWSEEQLAAAVRTPPKTPVQGSFVPEQIEVLS